VTLDPILTCGGFADLRFFYARVPLRGMKAKVKYHILLLPLRGMKLKEKIPQGHGS
jgi:hypothetical protein